MSKTARKSWTFKQLVQMIDPATEHIAVSTDVEVQYACICEEETNRMKALFVKGSRGRYVRMNLPAMVKFISEKLAPHFDAKKFLEELLLLQTPPDDVAELFERLTAPQATVREHKDCYTLHIGGKKGRPFSLVTVV